VFDTGVRLVEAVSLQRHMRGRRLNDDCDVSRLFTHYCTIVAVSATSDTARLSRYRYLPYSGVWHAQPTLDMDPVRGTTVCEVTAVERGTSCCRSVVGTFYPPWSVHRGRDRVLFIPRIPLSPTSLLMDSCTWRRRDEKVRKTLAFL